MVPRVKLLSPGFCGKCFWPQFLKICYCVYVSVGIHVMVLCRSQRTTFRSCLLLSLWDPGTKLSLSGLHSKYYYLTVIPSQPPPPFPLRQFHYTARPGIDLNILLPHSPQCWNYSSPYHTWSKPTVGLWVCFFFLKSILLTFIHACSAFWSNPPLIPPHHQFPRFSLFPPDFISLHMIICPLPLSPSHSLSLLSVAGMHVHGCGIICQAWVALRAHVPEQNWLFFQRLSTGNSSSAFLGW